MGTLRKAREWLVNNPHHLIGVRILQVSIGALLLFQIFTRLPFATYLWGPDGIGEGSTSPVLGPILGNAVDRIFTTNAGVFFVLVILGIGASGLLLGFGTRVATFLALVSSFLLNQRLLAILDSGDVVTQLVLIYMLFLLPHRAKFSPGELRVWLHNIAVLAITFQLVILYTTSGFAKAMREVWQHGVAMYYISQMQWFFLPSAHELFTNPLVVTVATYIPLFYELLFPVAIISRIKFLWILFGILFHLVIAVLMGLITFSTVMIGLVLFLISDQEYAKIRNRGRLVWKSISYASVLIFHKRAKKRVARSTYTGEQSECDR